MLRTTRNLSLSCSSLPHPDSLTRCTYASDWAVPISRWAAISMQEWAWAAISIVRWWTTEISVPRLFCLRSSSTTAQSAPTTRLLAIGFRPLPTTEMLSTDAFSTVSTSIIVQMRRWKCRAPTSPCCVMQRCCLTMLRLLTCLRVATGLPSSTWYASAQG